MEKDFKTGIQGVFVLVFGLFIFILEYYTPVITAFVGPQSNFLIALFITSLFLLSILSNITESVRIHRLKYAFVTVVTHKFRTPLTRIKWATDTLKNTKSEAERVNATTGIISANERLTELTDILAGSLRTDLYTYVFKAASFWEIVEEVLAAYTFRIKEKDIKLDIQIAHDVPLITLDINRIKLVIQIIFENAIHYTPNGGNIAVRVFNTDNAILFSVKDSGIGVSKHDLPHIFSDFYRSEEAVRQDTEGMGLGLYIAKKIIERHNGQIWAESEGMGKGATFYVKLHFAK